MLELYSGRVCSVRFKPMVSQLIAIESTHPPVTTLPTGCFDNVSLYEGAAEPSCGLRRLKARSMGPVSTHPRWLALQPLMLAELKPRILFTSVATPAPRSHSTIGRQRLQVQSIHAFDMFAQTYHIETATYYKKWNHKLLPLIRHLI